MITIKYICTQKAKPAFNYLGEKIGITPKMGLYYAAELGRSRVYRQTAASPQKGMRRFT